MVVSLPFTLGAIYLPLRLYLIGQRQPVYVVAVEIKEYVDYQVGSGAMHAGRYAIIHVDNYPLPISSTETNFTVGQRVQLLSSDQLGQAMVFPEAISLPLVLVNFNVRWGFYLVIQAILLVIGLSVGIPLRLYQFTRHLWQTMLSTWQKSVAGKSRSLDGLVALTDFLSQVITLLIATILIYLVIQLLIQALLLVENSGLIPTTILLIIAGLLFFLPFAERLVDLVLAIKNQTIWRKLLLITRNVLTIVAGTTLMVKLLQFPQQVDLRQFRTMQDMLLSFATYLFG